MQLSSFFASVLPPIHLFAYSALLGTQLYQSFVMTKITYQALPRSAFTTLQKRVFPIYFKSQSLLLLIVAITFPPYGATSMTKEKADWISFAIAGVTAGLNLIVYGPRAKDLMVERVHQATRDGKLEIGEGTTSDAMKIVNQSFSKAHAMSIHLNLMTIGATLWYGWRLALKLRLDVV